MRKLPEPSESWTKRGLDLSDSEHQMLLKNHLIEKTGEVVFEAAGRNDCQVYTWCVKSEVWKIIDDHNINERRGDGPSCPYCGFGSFINRGNTIECKECEMSAPKAQWR